MKWLDLKMLIGRFLDPNIHDLRDVYYFSTFSTWKSEAFGRHQVYERGQKDDAALERLPRYCRQLRESCGKGFQEADVMKLKRHIKCLWQRLVRGWDDSEIWNLDSTFAYWIVPRLQQLKKIKCGIPIGCFPKIEGGRDYTEAETEEAEKKWNSILDEMIAGFSLKQRQWTAKEWENYLEAPKEYLRAKTLFAEHLDDLWD